jgi:hypothetical protein
MTAHTTVTYITYRNRAKASYSTDTLAGRNHGTAGQPPRWTACVLTITPPAPHSAATIAAEVGTKLRMRE